MDEKKTRNPKILYAEIIEKCWDDEVFAKRFKEDPESVLQEMGIPIEEGVTYKVVEAPKLVEYLVLPHEGVQNSVQEISRRLLNRAEKTEQILPEGVELRFIQDTEDIRYLPLPASPKTLTKAELALVAAAGVTTVQSDVAVQLEAAVQLVAAVTEVEVLTVVTTQTAAAESSVVAVVCGVIVVI